VQVTDMGKKKFLGLYDDETAAARAFDAYVIANKINTDLNFPSAPGAAGHMTSKKGRTSSHRGVCWHKSTKKWVANIYVDGKQKSLGRFVDEDDSPRASATSPRTASFASAAAFVAARTVASVIATARAATSRDAAAEGAVEGAAEGAAMAARRTSGRGAAAAAPPVAERRRPHAVAAPCSARFTPSVAGRCARAAAPWRRYAALVVSSTALRSARIGAARRSSVAISYGRCR
jgi:hypothetical protein